MRRNSESGQVILMSVSELELDADSRPSLNTKTAGPNGPAVSIFSPHLSSSPLHQYVGGVSPRNQFQSQCEECI